jgi:hypothetical protein
MSEPSSRGSSTFDPAAVAQRLTPGRPLVIVDADEVILRFVDGFDRFLRARELYIDLSTYRLHGNVKRLDDNTPALDVEVTALLDEFRADLDSLEMVEGARETLTRLSLLADIAVLTNINPAQAPARVRNLEAHGFSFPIAANSGPKGPAVKTLAARAGKPVFFIDDIPMHHASVAETVGHVLRIHLVGDHRLKSLVPPAPAANLAARDWADAEAFMLRHIAEARA